MVFFILSHRQIMGNSTCFSRSSRVTWLHFIHHFHNHVLGFSEVASDAKKRNHPLSLGFWYTEQTDEGRTRTMQLAMFNCFANCFPVSVAHTIIWLRRVEWSHQILQSASLGQRSYWKPPNLSLLTIHEAFLHQANDQSNNVSFLNLEALEMQSIHLT